MSTVAAGAHVLIFPYPAQGHMIPLLDLTHQLAARGLTLTILVTPGNLPVLNPLLSSHPSIKTLVLPFPKHPSIPLGAENLKDMPRNSNRSLMYALGGLNNAILHWFRSHPSPPVAIISDFSLGWTHRLSLELGIRHLVFSPSGAMALSVMYSLWREMPKKAVDDEDVVISFPRIPDSPEYPWWQLSPSFRSYVEGDPVSEFVKEVYYGNMASWGLVVNSFTELEQVYLEHLRKELGHNRVWAVGPLLPTEAGLKERGGSSSISVDGVLSRLDTWENRTVIYVCFGSQTILSNDQMNTIALGLEKSEVRFVWSIKDPLKDNAEDGYGTIPHGFEDRVAGRGLLIKGWAPQVSILQHRSVGAFLTHCGWNSILEGIIAGVPFLAWPMGADQFVNADLLVSKLKVATRICGGEKNAPNWDELAEVFRNSVSESSMERERAVELSKRAREAMKRGGSSVKGLDELVSQLS